MCIRDSYKTLGVYLPLITTNCAILGVTLLNIQNQYDYLHALVNALGAGLGFMPVSYTHLVLSDDGALADCLSTTCFIEGRDAALEVVRRQAAGEETGFELSLIHIFAAGSCIFFAAAR